MSYINVLYKCIIYNVKLLLLLIIILKLLLPDFNRIRNERNMIESKL